jgi:arylsulfatase A-like enzyme
VIALYALDSPPVAMAADMSMSKPPNILLILADDLGWNDVGYHGSEIATPNIDRIASTGIELDRFYVQPTCSPTRAALMTGKSPMRLGINRPISKNQQLGLPLEETILPQYLARAGYQSLMVGKWHLGHYTPDQFPQARGFEHFYGQLTGGIGYWDHNHGGGHDWQRNGTTLREAGYSTQLIADEVVRVLAKRDRSRPTFFYVAFNAPQLHNEAPDEIVP